MIKITECPDGFVAEINNDEDFERFLKMFYGVDETDKEEDE